MKPILFNTEMVRASLDGRKTVMRQVVKERPKDIYWMGGYRYYEKIKTGWYGRSIQPIYVPGDILYVRETWARISDWTTVDPSMGMPDGFIYRADWPDDGEHPRWHPSIHMPKEAARLFLRVTDVWVEQLQEMTEEDAISEGIRIGMHAMPCIDAFRALWDTTIKKSDLTIYGWNANPWVWVVKFERCEEETR